MLGCAEEVLATWGVVLRSHSSSLDADLAVSKFTSPLLPPPYRCTFPDLEEVLTSACISSGFVQVTADTGAERRWDQWIVAGQIMEIESGSSSDFGGAPLRGPRAISRGGSRSGRRLGR